MQLYYRTPTAACQLRLAESWQVTLSNDLLRDLHGLLDEQNVQVIYA